MPRPKTQKEKSVGVVLCARPAERKELLRVMQEENLRTPFDVVRAMAHGKSVVKKSEFDLPRVRT